MVKNSHASVVLKDLFPNPYTNLVVTDPASSSQVLMLSVTKPSTDILVSTRNKDDGNQATDQTTTLTTHLST